jgi:inner membrane transporter RhtA
MFGTEYMGVEAQTSGLDLAHGTRYPKRMEPTSRSPAVPPLLAVLVGILSVQGGAALAKGLFPLLGPTGTVGLRIGISAAILLAAFRPKLGHLSRAQWRAVIPYGVVLGVMNLVFYNALSRIPLGLAVAVEFVGPLGVAVFGSRKPVDVLWGVLAGAGIALITPWTGGGGVDPAGLALAFAAGCCWAAYIVLGGRLSRLLPGGAAVSTGMLVAAGVVVPFASAAGGFAHLTGGRFAAGVGVALLSSAIPYTLEMIALKALPSRTFGILMSLEPAVAALVGLVFLHEILSAPQWLAVALVIAASVGSTVTARVPGGAGL